VLLRMERGKRRSVIHSPDYQYLLKRLRQARAKAGLTQVQVAKALGKPQSYVTKCELGERRIDPIDLQRFARLYRKPLSYFLPPGTDA
jgi:transcriptional regulator with XRE-family HTH domain